MTLQEKKKKKLNTTKKVVAITTNVIVIKCIATTKRSMQVIVIKSEAIGLCNTRFHCNKFHILQRFTLTISLQ